MSASVEFGEKQTERKRGRKQMEMNDCTPVKVDMNELTRRELQYLAKELQLCRGNAKSDVIQEHLQAFLEENPEERHAIVATLLAEMPEELKLRTPSASATPVRRKRDGTDKVTPRAISFSSEKATTPLRRSTRKAALDSMKKMGIAVTPSDQESTEARAQTTNESSSVARKVCFDEEVKEADNLTASTDKEQQDETSEQPEESDCAQATTKREAASESLESEPARKKTKTTSADADATTAASPVEVMDVDEVKSTKQDDDDVVMEGEGKEEPREEAALEASTGNAAEAVASDYDEATTATMEATITAVEAHDKTEEEDANAENDATKSDESALLESEGIDTEEVVPQSPTSSNVEAVVVTKENAGAAAPMNCEETDETKTKTSDPVNVDELVKETHNANDEDKSVAKYDAEVTELSNMATTEASSVATEDDLQRTEAKPAQTELNQTPVESEQEDLTKTTSVVDESQGADKQQPVDVEAEQIKAIQDEASDQRQSSQNATVDDVIDAQQSTQQDPDASEAMSTNPEQEERTEAEAIGIETEKPTEEEPLEDEQSVNNVGSQPLPEEETKETKIKVEEERASDNNEVDQSTEEGEDDDIVEEQPAEADATVFQPQETNDVADTVNQKHSVADNQTLKQTEDEAMKSSSEEDDASESEVANDAAQQSQPSEDVQDENSCEADQTMESVAQDADESTGDCNAVEGSVDAAALVDGQEPVQDENEAPTSHGPTEEATVAAESDESPMDEEPESAISNQEESSGQCDVVMEDVSDESLGQDCMQSVQINSDEQPTDENAPTTPAKEEIQQSPKPLLARSPLVPVRAPYSNQQLDKQVKALINSKDDLILTSSGRVRCLTTGHEMKADLNIIQNHLSGKKYLRVKNQRVSIAQYAPMFSEHPDAEQSSMVWCNVTETSVPRDAARIEAHMNGARYQKEFDAWKEAFDNMVQVENQENHDQN